MNEVRERGRKPGTNEGGRLGHLWKKDIFSCFSDCCVCCYGLLCPMCATATARSEYDGSNFCFNCMCVGGALTRSIIRSGLSIEVRALPSFSAVVFLPAHQRSWNTQGGCLEDLFVSSFLGPCSACQLINEVRANKA